MKVGDLVRFNRDTHCFAAPVPSNFTIPAGSVGMVLRKTPCVGRTQDYTPLFEVLVDSKILFEIQPDWSIAILSEGECL